MNHRLLIVCVVCVLVSVGGTATVDLSGAEPQHQAIPSSWCSWASVRQPVRCTFPPPIHGRVRTGRMLLFGGQTRRASVEISIASDDFYAGESTKKTAERVRTGQRCRSKWINTAKGQRCLSTCSVTTMVRRFSARGFCLPCRPRRSFNRSPNSIFPGRGRPKLLPIKVVEGRHLCRPRAT